MKRPNILQEADAAVSGARNADYGDPRECHQVTADLWNAYLRGGDIALRVDGVPHLAPLDVCNLMILLKIGRTLSGKPTRDTYVDIAGYARNAAICAGLDDPIDTNPTPAAASPRPSAVFDRTALATGGAELSFRVGERVFAIEDDEFGEVIAVEDEGASIQVRLDTEGTWYYAPQDLTKSPTLNPTDTRGLEAVREVEHAADVSTGRASA